MKTIIIEIQEWALKINCMNLMTGAENSWRTFVNLLYISHGKSVPCLPKTKESHAFHMALSDVQPHSSSVHKRQTSIKNYSIDIKVFETSNLSQAKDSYWFLIQLQKLQVFLLPIVFTWSSLSRKYWRAFSFGHIPWIWKKQDTNG